MAEFAKAKRRHEANPHKPIMSPVRPTTRAEHIAATRSLT